MTELSKIAWTKSTFNPWVGCTKVGPGCDHCYAEAMDARKVFGGVTHWGAGVPRVRTSDAYWRKPLAWNKRQGIALNAWKRGIELCGNDENELLARGFIKPEPWRVFCASLADVFDNEVDDLWRVDLFQLILATPNLSWLLVTKRIGMAKMLAPRLWLRDGFPSNVRLMISVVNQKEADRDIPKLLELGCKNGVSYEPALEPIDWTQACSTATTTCLDWIIVGGESAQGGAAARPFNIGWARSTIEQCKAAGVPVFVKQIGSNIEGLWPLPNSHLGAPKDRAGADPSEWPEDLRVREWPTA